MSGLEGMDGQGALSGITLASMQKSNPKYSKKKTIKAIKLGSEDGKFGFCD